MNNSKEIYLGDGLYASHDGYQFVLRTPRDREDHYVALEPNVLDSFFEFVEKTLNVKIKIEHKQNESGAV